MPGSQQNSAQYKRGIVKELKPEKAQARVEFKEEDGVASFWLSIMGQASQGNKQLHMPAVGSQVVCLVDWRGEDGVILGAVYSDVDKPPTKSPENDHRVYADGAVHEHDPVTNTHRISLTKGTLLLGVGGARLMIKDGQIISSVPITLGAVPDIPLRGS